MKFKALIAGLLAAILAVNTFMAYTVIQEEKTQRQYLETIARAKILEIEETDYYAGQSLRSIMNGEYN